MIDLFHPNLFGDSFPKEKKRDWSWLLLLIVYTTIFTAVSWEIAYKKGFERGQKAAEAPKMELKLVPVEDKKFGDEPINIDTGSSKYNDKH